MTRKDGDSNNGVWLPPGNRVRRANWRPYEHLAEVPECILSHHRKVIKHIHLIMPAASPGPLAVRYICAERAQRKTRQHQVLLESYIR